MTTRRTFIGNTLKAIAAVVVGSRASSGSISRTDRFAREPLWHPELVRSGSAYYVPERWWAECGNKSLYLDGRDITRLCMECNTEHGWAVTLQEEKDGSVSNPVVKRLSHGKLEIR